MDSVKKTPSCSKHLAIGFSREEKTTTDDTAKKPLTEGVIRKCFHKNEELIFTIFVWQNHDGTFRFILNLKSLWIASSLISINPITTPNWYLVKNGLKYADYLVPMQSEYRKYLKLFSKRNCLNSYIFPIVCAMGQQKLQNWWNHHFHILRIACHVVTIWRIN